MKKKKNKALAGIIVVVLILAVIGGAAGLMLSSRTANSEPERIYIDDPTTYTTLSDSLQTHGILTEGLNTPIFNFQLSILNSKVRPGSYVIEPHMNTLALVRKLRNGNQDPIRLTIGKFRTPDQLNEYLGTKLMHNDFNVTLDSFYLIRPNTYEFYWTVTPEAFMLRMEKEYEAFWEGERLKVKGETTEVSHLSGPPASCRLLTSHLSLKEIIVLASIVEEETNNNAEKPLIASVYLNRLKRGIPLQADPTVKYAVGNFALRRILNRHLAVESPFNTYLHTGLPPAPICLPSESTVDAVLNAPETEYIYFCASDKLNGTHRFAATLDEHNRNAAAYHRAITKQGIR